MRSEQDRSGEPDPNMALGILVWLIHCVSFTQELFTRRIGSMGRGYPSWAIACGGTLGVPLAAIAIAPPVYGIEFLQPYLWLVIGLSLLHSLAKWRKRAHVHTHSIGDPWFPNLGYRRSDFLIGVVLALVGFACSNTLGILHLVSLIASAMSLDLLEERDRITVARMKDAQLDAEYYGRLMEEP